MSVAGAIRGRLLVGATGPITTSGSGLVSASVRWVTVDTDTCNDMTGYRTADLFLRVDGPDRLIAMDSGASSAGISATSTACAASATQGPGVTAATSASGVTTRLTTGIATAFASGETTETCWKSSSTSGASPTVIAHCTRPHCASQCRRPTRSAATYSMRATAPNDSQKPADTAAHGSRTRTIASAAASTRDDDCMRSSQSATATTVTI